MAPIVLVSTWRNVRMGDSSITKRLDRFFMAEDLLGPTLRYISWVDSTYISDHAPIYLQIYIGTPNTTHPFKFNPVWLRDDTFEKLTREVWLDKRFGLIEGTQRRLVEKLSSKESGQILVKGKIIKRKGIINKIGSRFGMFIYTKKKGHIYY